MYVHIFIHSYIHMFMYSCIHIFIYSYKYIYIYIHVYICVYICMYVCIYVCMHVCMYVCMCIYIYNVCIGCARRSLRTGRSCSGMKRRSSRYAIYLLYWYKSTNTDAEGAKRGRKTRSFANWIDLKSSSALSTPLTCFTGTKVQLLTQKALLEGEEHAYSRTQAISRSAPF